MNEENQTMPKSEPRKFRGLYENIADMVGFSIAKELVFPNRYGHFYPVHFHKALEIFIMEKGEFVYFIDGKRYDLKEGDMVVIPSQSLHSCDVTGAAVAWSIIINPHAIGSLGIVKMQFDRYVPAGEGTRILRELFATLSSVKEPWRLSETAATHIDLLADPKSVWSCMTKQQRLGFAMRVVGVLMQYFTISPREETPADLLIRRSITYVEEHYKENVTANDLAKKLGYSLSYFSRTFNSYCGMNFREYLNNIRVQAVGELLRDEAENLSLAKAAELVGFESWSTFRRAYRKYNTEKRESEEGTFLYSVEKGNNNDEYLYRSKC